MILILGSVTSVMGLVGWSWSGHIMCVIGIRVVLGWRVGVFVEILVISLGRIRFLIMVVCVIVKLTSSAMWRRSVAMCRTTAKIIWGTERCGTRATSSATRIGCMVGAWGTASKARTRTLSLGRAARTLRGLRGATAWSVVGWAGSKTSRCVAFAVVAVVAPGMVVAATLFGFLFGILENALLFHEINQLIDGVVGIVEDNSIAC